MAGAESASSTPTTDSGWLPTVTKPAPNYTGAILAAWTGLHWAFTNAAVVVQPTAAEVDAAARIGATAHPHTVYPPQKIVAGMEAIDTSDCPADFMDAWRALTLALAQSETEPTVEVAADTTTNADLSEFFQQKKLQSYLINLKLISSSYGVVFR